MAVNTGHSLGRHGKNSLGEGRRTRESKVEKKKIRTTFIILYVCI